MLSVDGLSKRHPGASRPLFKALRFAVGAGEIVALVGESGVGKSTLLNCIAGLEDADAGEIIVGPDARDMCRLDEPARAALRAARIGFVFQAFHVLPTLTVAQNVAVPLLLKGVPAAQHPQRIEALLARVGLAGFGPRWPATLSGGELQRVSIARALVHHPALILADELHEARAGGGKEETPSSPPTPSNDGVAEALNAVAARLEKIAQRI